jgi:hypothetical protein
MNNGFTSALTQIREILEFAPDWAVAAILIALAVIVALGVHKVAVSLLTRFLAGRHPMLERIIAGTRKPARLALLVFALAVTLPAAPLNDGIAQVLSHILFITTIGLLGPQALHADPHSDARRRHSGGRADHRLCVDVLRLGAPIRR